MMRAALWVMAAAAGLPALAQEAVITSPIDGASTIFAQPDVAADSIRVINAEGASLRGLDKVSGEVVELRLSVGDSAKIGRIEVSLGECRYPEDDPAGEAYAWIEVADPLRGGKVFEGWMIASSPALSALDHPRYDVWVIRCTSA